MSRMRWQTVLLGLALLAAALGAAVAWRFFHIPVELRLAEQEAQVAVWPYVPVVLLIVVWLLNARRP